MGSPEQAADLMQAWFEEGGCHGITIALNDFQHDLTILVEKVIPILKQRGLRPERYLGTTLRQHFGLNNQLGLDALIEGK